MVFEAIKGFFKNLFGGAGVQSVQVGKMTVWMPEFVDEVNDNTNYLERKAFLLGLLIKAFGKIPENPVAHHIENLREGLEAREERFQEHLKRGDYKTQAEIEEQLAALEARRAEIASLIPFGGLS